MESPAQLEAGCMGLVCFWTGPLVDNQPALKSGSWEAGAQIPFSVPISITYKHLQPHQEFLMGSGCYCYFFLLLAITWQHKVTASTSASTQETWLILALLLSIQQSFKKLCNWLQQPHLLCGLSMGNRNLGNNGSIFRNSE